MMSSILKHTYMVNNTGWEGSGVVGEGYVWERWGFIKEDRRLTFTSPSDVIADAESDVKNCVDYLDLFTMTAISMPLRVFTLNQNRHFNVSGNHPMSNRLGRYSMIGSFVFELL